ncbi:CRISPR-associated endonuclease Cas2 [Candidatus Microgenomates bacterium]|nr:CRISPR-associated endonuclease Cas2 [Candidatus Microgenomates bacterium]
MGTKNSIAKFILLTLEKSIDGYVRYDDLIHHSYSYAWGAGWDRPLKKASLAQAVKRLRERGMIDFVSDEKLAYRLTDHGRQKAIWESIKLSDEKWDGKWRLVIFDVPEKRRQARNLLRDSLKKWGFIHWQQSVWATKKNCTKVLREFIKSVGIEDWVIVLESDNVGR